MAQLEKIKRAFRSSLKDSEPMVNVDTRRIVARFARGNSSLQLGKYVTEAQVAARREEVCNYNFRAACKPNNEKKSKK